MCQNKTPVITMDPVVLVNKGTDVSDQKAFTKLKKKEKKKGPGDQGV